MSGFYDKPVVDLGDPATDAPLTLRVHPDDDPHDPQARRAIKDADVSVASWFVVTGHRPQVDELPAYFLADEEVADWPYTNMLVASAAFSAPDPCRTFKLGDHLLGAALVATCSCNMASAPVRDRTEAGRWHTQHRRDGVLDEARALIRERGDMDVSAFKGGTP